MNKPFVPQWTQFPSYTSYQQFYAHFKTARFPDRGKRLNSGSLRLYLRGRTILIKRYGQLYASVTPANIITFHSWKAFGTYRYLPFCIQSTGERGEATMIHSLDLQRYYDWCEAGKQYGVSTGFYGGIWFRYVRYAGYRFFPGIRFNLTTRQCLNPKPVKPKPVEDPEVASKWRKGLANVREVLRTQHRLGVIDEWLKVSTTRWFRPDPRVIAQAVKTGTLSKSFMETLTFFMRRRWTWGSAQNSIDHTMYAYKQMLAASRFEAKKHFGVYRQKKSS